MNIAQQLTQAPKSIQHQYDENGLLYLYSNSFSWRFVPNLLVAIIFIVLGVLSLIADSGSLLANGFSVVLGLVFLGVMVLNFQYVGMYLLGSLEMRLSQQGGQWQWHWGKIAVGKPKIFYWQDLEQIYLAQPPKPDGDKDVMIVIKGRIKLTLHRFLRYKQLVYLEALLREMLAAHRAGTLDLSPDWSDHLLDG